jgi:hypothetical protein
VATDAFNAYEQSPKKKHTDRWYAELAAEYVDACRAGLPANRTVAERRGLSVHTVRNYVNEARRVKKLLTATPEGKQGGDLTEKALALLDQLPEGG